MNLYVLPCLHALLKPKAAHLTVAKKDLQKISKRKY